MPLNATPGAADADSYVTLAEYQAYAAAMGFTLTGDATTQEPQLRRARVAIDTGYTWVGSPATTTQALHFPEEGADIPQAVKDAQCEMAYLIQGGSNPLATIEGGAVKRTREKVGPLEEETEYTSALTQPVFVAVDRLLAGLTTGKASAGGSSTSFLLRA
jgi:hypothetical protein